MYHFCKPEHNNIGEYMSNFLQTCQTIFEGSLRRRQILANTAWASGGSIISIFHPISITSYKERIHTNNLITSKASKKIDILNKLEKTPKVIKNIKLLKLLLIYNQKAYKAHTVYYNNIRTLDNPQKKEFRNKYRQVLDNIDNNYRSQKKRIIRSYKK